MDNNSINGLGFIMALCITAWVIVFTLNSIIDYFSNWISRKTTKPDIPEIPNLIFDGEDKVYFDVTAECRSSVSKDLKMFFLYVDRIKYSFRIKNVGLETSRKQIMNYYLLENGKIVNQYNYPTSNYSYSRYLLFGNQEDKEKFIKAIFPPLPDNM